SFTSSIMRLVRKGLRQAAQAFIFKDHSMFLDEKPFIYLWRPLYQRLLVPYAYPVLNRTGSPAVVDLRNELDRLQEQNRTLQEQLTDLENLIRQLIARSSQLEIGKAH